MDWWDRLVTDGIGRTRRVILFDNRGVGLSSVVAIARDTDGGLRRLGVTQTLDRLAALRATGG
jgi:pimeloyl-ACP methyl ester carboxylesterase